MADLNQKIGPKLARLEEKGQTRTKGRDIDYWKRRLEHHDAGAKEWSVRIYFAGKRQWFSLGTANRDSAAARAKERYEFLKGNGWEATIEKFTSAKEKAKVTAAKEALTVGAYIAEAGRLASVQRERTKHDYGKCLRLVLSEILEAEGKKPTRAKVDDIKLEDITPARIEAWRTRRTRKFQGNPLLEEKAKRTSNSILRQAKAIFGDKRDESVACVLRRNNVKLPAVLPFAEVKFPAEDSSSKFERAVDPAKLVANAVAELDAAQHRGEDEKTFAARRQRFLAFVLVFAAGLRKSEADFLEWDSVDFEKGELTVSITEFFRPKTKASREPVLLDSETVAILRGFRAKYPKDRFVLRSKLKPRTSSTYSAYRAAVTWDALQAWLVSQGVTDPKPIHYCRKAITDFMANEFGILQAQRHARHTTPQVTARFYAKGKPVAPGVGAFFTVKAEEAEKVVEGDFTDKKAEGKKAARKNTATR